MAFHLRAATEQDLSFARALTHQAMNRYYVQNQLIWSNAGFDTAWAGRENWLICRDDDTLGFISLSRDGGALYIRELHLLQAYRGQGAGTWVLEQIALKAQALGLLRLTVFKTNPARRLYQRMGFSIVGEEDGFWRMERVCRVR
ncbi:MULTISPECIES: GNAT family N-acetyltransferase [Pseudomonas]|jgi:ribosomal protein S18 acetylase RimI-like enzyme|uniref:GNAT family N-acetyltransferase n=1 Tax=Pseudomonas synxantha TaxID=47883 RepID=A0A5D3G4P9_9PSED|nr:MULTISPECIES: GNAT family N-acetyltransferase [Pseudomonas]MCK3831164.1 N-acetyltransferase [Pseudomonas fluorescens]MCK3846893.1 N-acetyltransferase [Pseudomonas sp. W15Feb34]MCK3854086.1 N-acetyltransferase [Pseudomonas sp. W2Jun17]MCK3864868.1 N-acetyltransferase [Pseudomonas sp. B329]OPB05886.1 GNAT family N-acetyltransferase [Pseudomonas synxantha]